MRSKIASVGVVERTRLLSASGGNPMAGLIVREHRGGIFSAVPYGENLRVNKIAFKRSSEFSRKLEKSRKVAMDSNFSFR